jgi:Family of unknown function (DUF6214)
MQEITDFLGGLGEARYEAGRDDVVDVGNRVVPRKIRAAIEGGRDEPDVAMIIEVRQGLPVCTEIRFVSRADGPEVRAKDLKSVPILDWTDEIVAACSWVRMESGGIMQISGTQRRDEARRNVARARVGRPRVSPEQLEKVARVYREHSDDRPTHAVQRAFGGSYRTAARNVERARDAGLLPPTTPGKKKA